MAQRSGGGTEARERLGRSGASDLTGPGFAPDQDAAHLFDRSGPDWSRRLAVGVFVAVIAVAAVLYYVTGRHQWFFYDEWDFLAGRSATSLSDLLRPHNEHWSTIPILVYRALWRLVGLRSYRPYQALSIGAHLTTAVLLRAVMRRSGVNPWLATAAASLFVLLGSGNQDVIWAFQIGYVGAVMFGLAQLLLVVHDGPIGRRDALALAAGLAALMCSGVAVTMVIVVGIAALMYRGWRHALLHTAPLGVIYLAWWSTVGRENYYSHHAGLDDVRTFVADGVSAAFRGMGQVTGAAIVLAVLLVVGLALAASDGRTSARNRLAMPVALLIGAAVYLFISAVGRPDLGFSGANRYVHIVVALTIPAISVAGNAFVERWRWSLPVVLVVLVIGIPGNVDAMWERNDRLAEGSPAFMLTVPRLPIATEVPRGTRPAEVLASEVTVGWLLDGVRTGRVPPPPPTNEATRARWSTHLAISQDGSDAPRSNCQRIVAPVRRHLVRGQRLRLVDSPVAFSLRNQGVGATRASFDPRDGRTLTVRATIDVVMSSSDARHPPTICG